MYRLAERDLWTGRLDSETDVKQFRHFQTVNLVIYRKLKNLGHEKGIGVCC